MTIRIDSSQEIILQNIETFNNPPDIRDFLLETMKNERPKIKYRYFVETLGSGNRIYLERPGRLNKGCDFVIFIENHILFKNNNDKPPKHGFLLNDLSSKKKNLTSVKWSLLIESITDIYNCLPYNTAFQKINKISFIGEDIELILKLLRWFFIEQDITYWAKSGRDMLFDAIKLI